MYPHFLKCTTSGCRKGALPAQGKSQTSERAAKAGSIEAQAANNKIPPQLRSRRAAHSPGQPVGFVRHLSAITTRHRLQRAASVGEKLYPPSSTRLQRVAARRHAPSSAAVARVFWRVSLSPGAQRPCRQCAFSYAQCVNPFCSVTCDAP